MLRIEAGTPVFGAISMKNDSLWKPGGSREAICYTKGCFLGQEPIVMARDRGHVNRTLMGLKVTGNEPLPNGTRIFANKRKWAR